MENSPTTKKSFSLDWLVRGTLTKLGETFDRFTGRNWKPASNLATSILVERLKNLLDARARDSGAQGKFVPHNIKLLMQWDKFSTDGADESGGLNRLENELLVAAVDHINDKRYQTYAPLRFEIKADYFTEDVKLETSFGEFAPDEIEDERESVAVRKSVPGEDMDLRYVVPTPEIAEEKKPVTDAPHGEVFVARYTADGKSREVRLIFAGNARLGVGRTKENNLWIDDASVSKIHASLAINKENQLTVADTGSTNGTFVGDSRIAYGKAVAIKDGERVKFGTVEVEFERQEDETFVAVENVNNRPSSVIQIHED